MDWLEITAKTVDDALDKALLQLETTRDKIEVEIIEKETNGLLGLFSKPAKIRVKPKLTVVDIAKSFLTKVFRCMEIKAEYEIDYNQEENIIYINIKGDEMGLLIGKRGQTLDSLQYLTSLVVNKESDTYIKIKLDTENYRARRKETLENLAKNLSNKVKRTRQAVSLEPMNPYERRIIHSALQYDKFVETYSEGEEPERKVVIAPKKGLKEYNSRYGGYGNKNYHGNKKYNRNYSNRNGGYHKNYQKDNYAQKKSWREEEAEISADVQNTDVK